MSKYLFVIEKTANNYSAFCPDLPGCVATGQTAGEVSRNLQEAINFHLEGLRLDGERLPAPSSKAGYVVVIEKLGKASVVRDRHRKVKKHAHA